MQKLFRVIRYPLLVISSLAVPLKSFAAVKMESIWPTGYWGGSKGLLGCSGIYCNEAGFCGIVQVILNVISFGISIAFFVLLPIFLTWGGIVILTSQGNPGKLGEGKKILTGTLVGVLITLGGYLILQTFTSFLNLNFLDISALSCR